MVVPGRWLLLAAVAAGAVAGCAAGEPAPYLIDLGGEHRLHPGDDPGFADPGHDDSTWSRVRVPGIWRTPWFSGEVFAWYRIRFELPPELPRTGLALDLGVVGWADEAFVNGRRVGGTGSLDHLPRIAYLPRLYPLPADVLRGGANLLAIRVRTLPLASSGLLSERIGIGDQRLLAESHARLISRVVATEAGLMGFLAFGWLLVAFLPKRGRIGRATLLLWASVTMQLAHLWLFSLTARRAGLALGTDSRLGLAVTSLGITTMWAFLGTVARERLPRPLLALIAAQGVIVLFGLLRADLVWVLLLVSYPVGAVGVLYIMAILVQAARARTAGALPLLIGYAITGAWNGYSLVLGYRFLSGVPMTYYGLAFQAAAALFALTLQVRELNRQMQRASQYALQAHTRERTRLARDLHDGLGQMLALLKLQLQRTERKLERDPERESVADGVSQVDATLEELRRIARDLRPTPMQDRGFGEAVREYATAMARRSALAVEVEGDYQGPLSEELGDELYRIVQECLTNCLKHSGARRVIVVLGDVAGRYLLTVTDDGRGLAHATPSGLGLATIRERSQLLGGQCTIGAGPGGGTRVEVSVPKSGPAGDLPG